MTAIRKRLTRTSGGAIALAAATALFLPACGSNSSNETAESGQPHAVQTTALPTTTTTTIPLSPVGTITYTGNNGDSVAATYAVSTPTSGASAVVEDGTCPYIPAQLPYSVQMSGTVTLTWKVDSPKNFGYQLAADMSPYRSLDSVTAVQSGGKWYCSTGSNSGVVPFTVSRSGSVTMPFVATVAALSESQHTLTDDLFQTWHIKETNSLSYNPSFDGPNITGAGAAVCKGSSTLLLYGKPPFTLTAQDIVGSFEYTCVAK